MKRMPYLLRRTLRVAAGFSAFVLGALATFCFGAFAFFVSFSFSLVAFSFTDDRRPAFPAFFLPVAAFACVVVSG